MKRNRIAPSTKTGFEHWLAQRVSAVAMIPLMIWLIISFIKIAVDPESFLPVFFAYPFNALMSILFFAACFYHGSLGMRVIIEDYIENKSKVHFYIMLVNFVSILSTAAVILAILRLHFS